ncbi:MAG: gamma-glutamyltransferase, partial [Nocardioides sp.]|uniref:gamma-glutamyltransferase n=1 Tax=Nocardioides sp. TaxID=35761 RepID=UPI0039E35CBD
RTLRRLAEAAERATAAGADREAAIDAAHAEFYTGDIAGRIVDFVTGHGGTLGRADLAGFRAEVAPAPYVGFGDWRVHVTPTWSQGPIIAQTLGILERRGIRSVPADTVGYVHEVVEALKLAFSERERCYGDPRFTGVEVDDLLGEARLSELAKMVGEFALPNLPTVEQAGPRLPSTTAIVAVDGDGNAFSSSPSDTIDGGPIIPELGLLCSPRGVQSRLVPGHPNALRPGGRPCVTPAAVIALCAERDGVWAAACPGGDVIVQAIVQAMLRIDVHRQTPQAAVEAPRFFGSSFPGGFHPHPTGDSLVFLEEGFDAAVGDDLEARGHQVVDWPANEFDAGSVQTIVSDLTEDGERLLAAGADSRRSAYAHAR